MDPEKDCLRKGFYIFSVSSDNSPAGEPVGRLARVVFPSKIWGTGIFF
jgi:hypothetical protein